MLLLNGKFCSLAGAKMALTMKGCHRVSAGGGLSGSGGSI